MDAENKRQRDNQPGQTREVNGRQAPNLAAGRQEAEEDGWNECLTKFALLDFMLKDMLCFYVFGCNLGHKT